VRAAAQVGEGGRVPVGRHHRVGGVRVGVDLLGPAPTASMISTLNGWSSKSSSPSSMVCSWRMKGWSSAMISRITASMRTRSSSLKLAHPAARSRSRSRSRSPGDGVVGAGPQPQHGLGEHVGAGVAEHRPALLARRGDDGDHRAVGQLGGEVDLSPVEARGDRVLGEASADGFGQVQRRRSLAAPCSIRQEAAP